MKKPDATYISVKRGFYDLVKAEAAKKNLTLVMISRVVLGENDTYLSSALGKGRVTEEYYGKLIDWLGIQEDYDKYILAEGEEDVYEEPQSGLTEAIKDLVKVNQAILEELQRVNYVTQEIRTATRLVAKNTQDTKTICDEIFMEVK